MTNNNSGTNGASLEDCHSNLFFLTDVCGIKWSVLRPGDNATNNVGDPLEDPVLSSFARCLDAGLLSVWRRVPRRYLVDYSFDNAGNQIKTAKTGHDDKNQLSQCRELWLFWYGERPDQLKTILSPSLKEISDISGSWESGIPYEARTLLFKALNNLIERSLLSKQFVRIGKWFVQPFDGWEKPKSCHLSFSFAYFIHGESAVCASVDVREHPPVRRLNHSHLAAAASLATTVQVILAPYGMAGTLTGVTYKADDPKLDGLLEEWEAFWPLNHNCYSSRTVSGIGMASSAPMPAAVEVLVSGVKLIYPACYVLVTDLDGYCPPPNQQEREPAYAYSAASLTDRNTEPGPFTVSNHSLLSTLSAVDQGMETRVWDDSILPLPSPSEIDSGDNKDSYSYLKNWEFRNPARPLKQKPKSKHFSRDRFKELRARYHGKNPFHRKHDSVHDDLAWTLDQDGLCNGVATGRLAVPTVMPGNAGGPGNAGNNAAGGGNGGNSSRVPPNDGHPLPSPLSVGPVTPRAGTGPDSVKTEPGNLGSSAGFSLVSPQPPLSNGPTTPASYHDSIHHPKTPGTPGAPRTPGNPRTPGGPRSQQPVSTSVPSPYHRPTSAMASSMSDKKPDPNDIKLEPSPAGTSSMAGGLGSGYQRTEYTAPYGGNDNAKSVDRFALTTKRPVLPKTDYDMETESDGLTSVYDYSLLSAWLSHPVKRYRGQEQRTDNIKRPMYRRRSQSMLFFSPTLSEGSGSSSGGQGQTAGMQDCNSQGGGAIKSEVGGRIGQQGLVNGYGPGGNNNLLKNKNGNNGNIKTEFGGGGDDKMDGSGATEDNLFSADGLKPSLHDLDNLFDDSDSPPDGNGNGGDMEVNTAVPTPPSSVKDVDSTKHYKGGKDPAPNLGADQLQQMFPTPPSHEHPNLHSPADNCTDLADNQYSGNLQIKRELRSPPPHHHSGGGSMSQPASYHHSALGGGADIFLSDEDELDQLLSSSQFAPLTSLYSDTQPRLAMSEHLVWKQRPPAVKSEPATGGSNANTSTANNNPPSVSTPSHGGSASNVKPGLSPISPAPSLDNTGPKSNAGPGSVGPPSVGPPRSVGPPSLASPAPSGGGGKVGGPASVSGAGSGGVNSRGAPTANSLTVNLVLSGESLLYLPDINSAEDYDCKCGYSAVMNRKLSYLAGMFLEDEREVTGIQEDVYFKKKHSLLLLDPKSQEHGEAHFNERAEILDSVPAHLLELMQRCITMFPADHNTLVRFSRLYHRHAVTSQPHQISVVEALDGAEVVWSALEVVRQSQNGGADSTSASTAAAGTNTMDATTSKAGCLHKWAIMPTPGPFCTEDIIRVMKVLLPVLNSTLHSSGKGNKDTPLSVEGPLTWRQFHRMAGVTTKGNTDDGCEPLPIPTLTVGHEKEFITVSPSALSHWDALSLEPWGPPRDIAYVILCPDNENILTGVKGFFRQLNNTYSRLKLGKHLPIAKTLRDGVLRVGAKQASRLENESDIEEWFSCLGDTPNAEILKLYAKVCIQYLVPFLSGLTHDATLLRPPPQEGDGDTMMGENKENIAEPVTPEEESTEPPAIVIYMVDPLSFVTDNPDLVRLSSLALLRCFHALVPKIKSESIRESVHLQTLSLEAVYNIVGGTGADFGCLGSFGGAGAAGGRSMSHATELNPVKANARASNFLRGLAFSVFAQSNRRLSYLQSTKTLTGFGPASTNTRFLKGLQLKDTILKNLYAPPYVLAPPPLKNKKTSDGEGFGSTSERRMLLTSEEKIKVSLQGQVLQASRFTLDSTVLFVHYCLSDDQRHLLASLSDDRGELVKTTVINIQIPNRTRRKKASARRVGLSRLWDWILSVLSLSLVPWRLVIGRLGRIGHGELRGWSVLLSRKSLKKVVKMLKDECPWKSDVPCLLSVCLVSIEPDGVLRVMSDQFTPDPRFGGSAAQCALSTPRDTTATHILVFPTSATAQSSQAAFNEHQESRADDDLGFGLDIDDLNPTGNGDEDLGFGDLNDIFTDDPFATGGIGGSPGEQGEGQGAEMGTGVGGNTNSGQDPAFRYGQEEPGERLEILQQPLALGYLTSTAPTGDMPRWFWSSAPHLESTCPVFLKNSLHINVNNLAAGGDDGFTPQAASARVHSLDSNYTTDVLRYVLEGYNAMSWLVLDPQTRDRVSCLPIHVQALLHLYHAMAAIA